MAEGWVLPGCRGGAGVGRPVSAFLVPTPFPSFPEDPKDWVLMRVYRRLIYFLPSICFAWDCFGRWGWVKFWILLYSVVFYFIKM